MECDGLDDEDIYVDLGEDDESEIMKEIDKRIDEARKAELSKEGEQVLTKLLNDNRSIFD